MRAWFDRLHEQVRAPQRHLHIFDPPKPELFTAELLDAGDALFAEAEEAAIGDDVATEYVAKAKLSLRYVRIALHPRVDAEFESFLVDLRRFGVTQVSESRSVDAFEADLRRQASAGN